MDRKAAACVREGFFRRQKNSSLGGRSDLNGFTELCDKTQAQTYDACHLEEWNNSIFHPRSDTGFVTSYILHRNKDKIPV
jgi:hypothetical protein